MHELLKEKKKIGIFIVLALLLATFGVIYLKAGYKELKKNDTESIFVDDIEADKSASDTKNNISTKNSEISVPAKSKEIVVEIKGEVKKPDVYMLDENAIVKDLIDMAGGLTENADLGNINRAKKLQNHELVYISNKNEASIGGQSTNSQVSTNSTENMNKKVNINTATLDELNTLNGIGDSKAKSIIEYREQNGGFSTIEDIKNVTGIGDKMFEKIKEQIET